MYWKTHTWKLGGGDHPGTSVRYYRYCYDASVWERFKRRKFSFDLPFESRADFSSVVAGSEDEYKQRTDAHKNTLRTHPFYINGTNVIDWLEASGPRGSIVVEFRIDSSLHFIVRGGPEYEMNIRFSDPGLAAMFKLAFAGM